MNKIHSIRDDDHYAQSVFDRAFAVLMLATEGERNSTLNKTAFAFGGFIAAGRMDEQEIREILTLAAHQIGGMTDEQIQSTITSGFNAGKKTPWTDGCIPTAKPNKKNFNPWTDAKLVETYDYQDKDGKLLFQSVRFLPKTFRQRRPDGNGGWIKNLDGTERVLYRLPELIAADPDQPIFITEGEKDCNSLVRLGFAATTNSGGGDHFNLIRDLSALNQRHVIITPHPDKTGDIHQKQIMEGLSNKAKSIKILKMPDDMDVTEYLESLDDQTPEALKQLILDMVENIKEIPDEEKSPSVIHVMSANELLTKDWPEPEWIINGFLIVGLSILAGKQKIGKSWMGLQLALAVATGGILFGQPCKQGKVLYCGLEDSPRRLRDRCDKQGWPKTADCDFMGLKGFIKSFGNIAQLPALLINLIETKTYRLVVIDTLSRAVRGDQNDSDAMTSALSSIQSAAVQNNVCVLFIDHHKKNLMTDSDVLYDVGGSVAKTAVADTIWGLYSKKNKLYHELIIVGRDVEEQSLRIEKDSSHGLWTLRGESSLLQLSETRQSILDLLESEGPMSSSTINRMLELDQGNTWRMLVSMEHENLIIRTSDKKYAILR